MQSCTLPQLYAAPILYRESAGNTLVSSISPDQALFNSGPAVEEDLYGFDQVPHDVVLQSNLPSYSVVQPVTYRRQLRASAVCDSCRKRKTKCDEDRPQCSSCRENGHTCSYRNPTAKKDRDLSHILERFDRLETIIRLQNNPRSCPPYKIQCQDEDRGSYFRPLDPSYYPHCYIDRDGGREDFIEVLSPELLPWLAKFVDLDHEQMTSQPPAFFTACQIKHSLHRYTMDPTMAFADVSLGMILEIDGILRAQTRHNLSRLKTLPAQDILKRACLALLALHLQKSIGKLGTLSDFSVEADGFLVLRTLSIVSEKIDLRRLVQDDSFQFDLHFADVYPSSWFPKAGEAVATPQHLDATSNRGESQESGVGGVGDIQVGSQVVLERQKEHLNKVSGDKIRIIVEAVGGIGCDPFILISRENLWKYSLCLHHLLTRHRHSPLCNPQHLSKALTSINHCLRESLKGTLRGRADILSATHSTEAFVQPVLDFLTLNIGTEITRGVGEHIQRGRLRHIMRGSDNTVTLHIQCLDNSWRTLKGPIQQVPFLWMSNCFAMKIVESEIALPPQWFSSH